jgi:hypothetical protein
MKYLFIISAVLFLFSSCFSGTDMKVHTPGSGDAYCSYSATGAGAGAFNVCVFCPTGASICGTLKEIRILRVHHWITPNEYDYYTLTSTGTGCSSCTGELYLEKE